MTVPPVPPVRVAVPPVELETAVTVRLSPSTSVSLARIVADTLPVVVSSVAVMVSSFATGASLTDETVMLIVPVSLPSSLWAVYVVEVVPCQFAAGTNV